MSYKKEKTYIKIPKRWKKCPRKGELIEGIFLPFKTPLDNRYESRVRSCDLFTPQMLISSVESYKLKLGLLIDLTFTTRYYDRKIIENKGTKYVKCHCIGHEECPTLEQTQMFLKICSNFIAKNPLKVIGVHCTHGYNRTGFLICAYLIEKLNWSLKSSLNTFAKARSPGIYKLSYIQELFKRYENGDIVPEPPPLPEWFNYNKLNSNKDKSFMEEVTGVSCELDLNKCRLIELKCQTMCNFTYKGFPGSHPVSLDYNNINLLQSNEYMVSWKADGTRYMMLIIRKNEIYLLNRECTVFKVKGLSFPCKKQAENHLENTLLDGEMITDIVNGIKIPRYLIYDIVYLNSINVGANNFRLRLLYIDKEVIGPREKAKAEKIIERKYEPFGIRKKDFWELHNTLKIFEDKFKSNIKHQIDGLIFQPFTQPYFGGKCDSVLKWKPLSHNSVDFKLKVSCDDIGRLIAHLFVGGYRPPFATMNFTKDLKRFENKIIECTFETSNNQWKFLRERVDKSFPNSYNTAIAILKSIRFPITKEALLNFIKTKSWRKKFNSKCGYTFKIDDV